MEVSTGALEAPVPITNSCSPSPQIQVLCKYPSHSPCYSLGTVGENHPHFTKEEIGLRTINDLPKTLALSSDALPGSLGYI